MFNPGVEAAMLHLLFNVTLNKHKVMCISARSMRADENSTLYLEVKVGVLSPGYLVLVDISVAGFHGGSAVKRSVEASGYLPVFTVVIYLLQSNTCDGAGQNDKKSLAIMVKLTTFPQ